MPFVLHGRSEDAPPHAYFDIDNEGAILRSTRHLVSLGHRRIGFINDFSQLTFAIHRDRGYRRALAEAGIEPDAALMLSGHFSDEMGYRFGLQLLELPDPPTGIVVGSTQSALGVMRAVRVAGMTVGEDVSIVAHDDALPYLKPEALVPALTTTRSSLGMAGARIADLLVEIIGGRPAEEVAEVWPVEFLLRDSTARAPAPKTPV